MAAAAVLLQPGRDYPYRDSKTLTRAERARLAARLRGEAVACAVAFASAAEVDALNVLGATRLAARRAVALLGEQVDGLVTDYLELGTGHREVAAARADATSYQVAAASVLAKHERDLRLQRLEDEYPGYGFARHAGYGVPEHLRALRRLGPCPHHRRSFAPVAAVCLFGADGS